MLSTLYKGEWWCETAITPQYVAEIHKGVKYYYG